MSDGITIPQPPDPRSLDSQVRAVGRELGMRRVVYPKWVRAGRMTISEADWQLDAMDAAYETLKALQAKEAAHG